MLMGGVKGLTIFNPEQITENIIAPKMLISGLKINNESVIAGKKINNKVILTNSISNTKELVLNHNNRNISLDIIVQHNSTPKKNRLAYMLEEINRDWVEVSEGKATATYTNLSAGTYKFLYKGANGDGNWTAETQELIIQVLAPWYLRWISIVIWVLILISIIYIIFKYLVRLEKLKQELNFEQLDKERVHEMDQAKMRFFTNVSHDFKTPLSLIMGPLEKISERNKGLEDQKYFSIIQNNILRLQRLIDQLVSYRKAEAGHLVLSYSKTSLGDFIYPLMDAFENYSQGNGVNFHYKINSPNKFIVLDINKIERVLLNLFSNAIKYVDSNREVSIEVGLSSYENQESFYIEVANSGMRIPADKIDKIFDRFYRVVEDNDYRSGTGIGLEMCKSLVNLMNGTITVTSDAGQKTVFKINIPFNESLQIENEPVQTDMKLATDWLPEEIDGIQEQPVSSLLPNLLIVDDEKDVRTFLHEAFKTKYNITLAVDGEDGLEKLNKTQPQLIISDVMMPKLNGYQFCEKIKSSSEHCHIPVVLLTAMDDDAKKLEGLELGADDYITKPFSIKYLELRVKKLIENKLRVFEYFSRNSHIPTPNEPIKISVRDKAFLEKLISTLDKNISNSAFGVEELAVAIGMSTSSLFRRLKQLTGQSPIFYLRNFRLQKAAEILKADSDLIATEVMQEIGIESTSYYSTSFKKLHGYSPSEFVKRLKG
jgi:signal transduction histidine kinase/CheY-like chemotaxis protein